MSLASHRFGRVEFRIFLLIFSTVPACGKQQQIFKFQNSTHPNRWAAEDMFDWVEPSINQLSFETDNVLFINTNVLVNWDIMKFWSYAFEPHLTYCLKIPLGR